MKSIAQDLGVSVVTVSKVLHNHADISSDTRKRVLRRMKQVNYQPNPAARALSTGRSNLMGLVVPDLVHPFFAQVAKVISAKLRAHGYSLIIASSEESPQLERREIDQMIARRVDALFLASTENHSSGLQKLKEKGVPFVLLDRRFSGLTANFVGINDVAVGSLATKHLIQIGCETIAHISGSHVSTALDRRMGYQQTLADHGMTLPPGYTVKQVDHDGDSTGYASMKKLLLLNPRPDGLFCYNDTIALGAMQAVLEAGLKIPGDIAIIGCGNAHFDNLLQVPLTSIDQDAEGLGDKASRLALALIHRKNPGAPKTVLLKIKLVIRGSTQP
jgi:LacI family transcriptional regulator